LWDVPAHPVCDSARIESHRSVQTDGSLDRNKGGDPWLTQIAIGFLRVVSS
jgi:hypothetical protein